MSISRKDNTLGGAKNLRELGNTKSIAGFVGKQDKIDFYKFTLARSSNIALSLTRLKANADVTLLNNSGVTIASSNQLKKLPESIATTLEAGTYYIRVNRRQGNTRYKLEITATTEPGSSLESALDTGTLAGDATYQGSIGNANQADYYKLNLSQNSDFYASLNGLTVSTDLNLIVDANNNGFVDGDERIATGYSFYSDNTAVSRTLPPGVYFVEVRTLSSNSSSYSLTLSATAKPGNIPTDPGDSLTTAHNLSKISGKFIAKDLVGAIDQTDYYQFTLKQISEFSATLSRLSESVDIDLIFDANKNGFLDGKETIAAGYGSTFGNDSISETLPPGTYLIRVESSSYNNTIYDLNLSVVPKPSNLLFDPGSSLGKAYNLGALSSGTLSSDRVVQDFVGTLDKADYYKFTLDKAGDFNATLSGLSDAVTIELVRDLNHNGLIDGNERIDYGNGSTSYNYPIATSLPAGTYFIEVEPGYSTSTAYTLTLSS